MIRQHLYRVNADGGRTIAVSDGFSGGAWLNLLEEQLSLIDFAALSVPVYYQYPLGRALVMSRCSMDPYTPEKSVIAHQLVIENPEDLDELLSLRPMKGDLLPAGIFGYTDTPDTLPSPSAADLCDPAQIKLCKQTLTSLFRGDEPLLARFLAAVSLCARDKRHSVRVLIGDSPENVTEAARRIMEMTQRALPREDVLRLSFCSFSAASAAMQYTVCFMQKTNKNASADPCEILLDLTENTLTLPEGLTLPAAGQLIPQARSMMAEDASPARAARIKSATAEISLPPFAEGMSIRQYFADWRAAMEAKKSEFTEEAFRPFASEQWPALITAIIAASDLMDNSKFIAELNSIISQIRRDKLETVLSMSNNTLTDLLIILLDSISWRQIDLSRPQTARLMRTVCAYAQVLTEDQCPSECLYACRIIYSVLASPAAIHESLIDLSRLESASPTQFEALQDCLRQYVEKRLSSDMDVIDESLAAAAMLGFARFSEGIPDLRLADMLAERIENQLGHKAARRFEQCLDKLRSHLHSTPGSIMRRRDMKLFLFISLLLLILIAAITVGFLLLY